MVKIEQLYMVKIEQLYTVKYEQVYMKIRTVHVSFTEILRHLPAGQCGSSALAMLVTRWKSS